MPFSAHQGQRSESDRAVNVLDAEEYENIRKKSRTFEFHLARALFPRRKITANAVAKMVSRRIPDVGKYNVIFHLSHDIAAVVTDQLVLASHKLSNTSGHWFLLLHHGNRKISEARTKKSVPLGRVSSTDIDNALAAASEKRD